MRQPQARSSGFERNAAFKESTGNELALHVTRSLPNLAYGCHCVQVGAADIARMGTENFDVISINSGAAISAVLPTDRSSAA
jgi:hypothetical protein